MTLQSDDLAALGLGITADQPPIALQPTLGGDGIHLRYATSFAKGLPWYGFYLLRRAHVAAPTQCLLPQLAKLPARLTTATSYAFSRVTLYSGTAIEFIDEFPAAGTAEIALPRAALLGASFAQAPIHRVTARIGFRGGPLRGSDARPSTVRMVAKDNAIIVAETLISGRPGEVVAGEVNADRITAVEFFAMIDATTGPKEVGPVGDKPPEIAPAGGLPGAPIIQAPKAPSGHAALVDLCWETVSNAATIPWQPVPNYPQPMPLPVAAAGYPCEGRPANQAAAQAMALSRVRYGVAANWAAKFGDLHAVLTKLVAGGPGGGPINSRTDTFVDPAADPDTPALPNQNILQLIQLASIDPAMAQILGLYWLDLQAVPGQAYDYMVLADHVNAFSGQPVAAGALAIAAANGTLPTGVDAWITYNHVAQPRAPLAAPPQPTAFVLPDTAVSGAPNTARGAVGISWNTPSLGSNYLSSSGAVRYIVWRHDHGDPQPATPAASFVPLNPNSPYLAGSGGSSALAQAPTDWPPVALRAVDRKLADGWYGYSISGIDIWGRYSLQSVPAQWRQWAPAPQPEPWYYQGPAADKQLHAFAVHILDKTPPPPPAAVEATALDPDDDLTYVRDAAYTAWRAAAGDQWWNGLTDAQRAAVLPLRVRWRWYPTQQAQHPNTREFRIYFNPDSVPPGPDRFEPTNWQDRIFVCDYNDHVTLVSSAAGPYRQYEVLPVAPPPGVPPFAGVALQPSLTAPIVYANISVSAADDKIHTGDRPKWNATPWGNRFGNESVLAAAAKIYRVWRALPPAPAAVLNDERVWTTKADYHSFSFYTFRWAASADLKAHVYAVMDATLFMVERAREDIAAVSAADIAALQTLWNPVPQSLIDQIAALRTLKAAVSNQGTPSDADRKQHDADWDAACAALSDGVLRGLAALPLHEDSYVRQTPSPVDDPDAAGPDDPPGYAPNPLWRAFKATFDGRARNRYFLRVSYIDDAHNEGPLGPPSPPIYLPPAVPPRKPVITKVTGGDRSATVAWTTAKAEAGGRYVIYRTDDDYRLRDVRLMDVAATISSGSRDPNSAKAEWTDSGLEGGKAYHYCLAFIDAYGNASEPSKPVPVNVVDLSIPSPPFWTEQTWLLERASDNALIDWPADGVVPTGHAPVLRLSWASDVKQPVFVLSRRERNGRAWSAPPGIDQIVASASSPGEFSWIDRGADPVRIWDYRLRVRAPTGVWAAEYALYPISKPLFSPGGVQP